MGKASEDNSAYRGTLSSYGYVLMVLHFLINVAMPPVVPNLQHFWRPPAPENEINCQGYDVRFWRDERAIKRSAEQGFLSRNRETVGSLLRGFFEYFSYEGNHVIMRGFHWGTDVLSLRT